jgi:hypothetical protein
LLDSKNDGSYNAGISYVTGAMKQGRWLFIPPKSTRRDRMKKAVVLGMILLALGTFAFADGGVTVGLDFGRTQFVLASGSSVSGSQVLGQVWVDPTGTFPTGQRQDFQFAWSNQYMGVNSTFYIGNGYGTPAATYPNLYVQALYGTLKLIPDMFSVVIGEFQADGWDHFRLDSPHPIYDVNNNNVGRFVAWGAILDLMPKDSGFEAGVYLKTPDPTQSTEISGALSNDAVILAYTVPNLVKVMAGTNTFATYNGVGGSSERNILASVQLLMVANLTAFDEFYFAGFDQTPSVTIYSDELAFQYVMKPLTIIFAGFFGGNSAGAGTVTSRFPGYGSPDYARFWGLGADYTVWALDPEFIYDTGMGFSLGLYASIWAVSTSNAGVNYIVEPYVKLNNFGLRIAFEYAGNSQSGAVSTWAIPILIDWGF